MINFNPPVIVAHSQQNSFTTLDQPFPVGHTIASPGDNPGTGIWESEPWRNEQGLTLEVPIFSKTTDNQYVETTLIDYPVDTSTDYLMADTNVICHWVTVPYQTVGGSQNIDNPNHLDVGVIAFHGSGQLDRVEFFLNGNTQRTIVTEPSHHPDHDVTAYWIRIDNTSGLTDSGDVWGTTIRNTTENGVLQTRIDGCTFSKHHELQAVVYPKVGKPRILAGKHNNHKTQMVYNGIFRYWEDSQEKKKTLGTKDNGIRSFYFSSNFNDTLFQGSVYVSADTGVDDLTRSGSQDEPMNSIDFAYRKLMRMKHKFYNNLSTEPTFNYDNPSSTSNRIRAEVGGGTIFLMKHISEKNKQNGHRSGYKNLAVINNDLIVPYQAFSKMRWVTTRPASGVSKKEAMVKGYHLQPFDKFVGTDDELNKSRIEKINGDIRCTLMQYKNCFVETDWPYSEMMFGIGPDLDVIGDDGRGSKLIELKNWIPKRGILTKNYDPFSLDRQSGKEYRELNHDYVFTLHNDAGPGLGSYQYVSETNIAEQQSGPYVPPRFWLDDCHFDGLFRSRQKIYDWANSLGMTHTTTFVGPPDIEGEQRRRKQEDPALFNLLDETKIGVFSTLDNRKMNDQLVVTGPNGEGLSLTTPRIYVEPTEQTLVLTNGLGFTLGVGYTFDFCFAHPEFGGCRSSLANRFAGGGIPSFVTNTFLQNIDNDPSSLGLDSFINSTLCNYNGDVFRNTSTLIYQPFVYDSLGTRNYVNNSDSRLFGVHSDIFQTVGGAFNFKSFEVGVNNFIFYRFNNPSPRSKRYSDINARHGLPGEGPLDNITFEKQWSISGRHGSIDGGDTFNYDNSIYPEGDRRVYTYWNNPHVKDIIFQDCLVYTPDASQELQIVCYHENTIYRNTYVHYSPNFQNFPNGFSVERVLDFSPRLLGSVIRYRDAVPNHPLLNSVNNDLSEQVGACAKRLLLDNYQCYQTKQKINPSTGKLFSYGTYQEPLKFNVVRENGRLVNNVNINGFFRPKPLGHSLYGPVFGLSNYLTVTSDLRYPFERDSSGNAGPNQSVGNTAKIAFPSASDRYANAFRSYIEKGNALPQPNSSTRGEWFTYHKTIPASTTFGDAPYGWIYSETPYENFKYGRLPHPSGTIQNSKNAAIQAIDPTFLIKKNKDDGAGGLTWGITINDTRAALGTGWDPTFGTGKLNPQPNDAGFCANQRGFRESVYFTFSNFDYDATRSEFGEVLTPDRLPILSGESGENPTEQTGEPPSPILNHPITIRLSTTDLTENMSWSRKDHLDNSAGTTHGPDGIYSSSDLIQIPNYLERIEEVTDPNSSPEIGESVNTEIIGNTFAVGNQGGVYVTGGVADFTLDATIGKINSLDVKNISTIYLNRARKNNGLTMSLILHGKSVPGTSMAEFKYLAASQPALDNNGNEINDGEVDLTGIHYSDFYKKFAYIAFNSKESPVTQSITSNQFSFRKSPHHTFIQFNRAEIDGLSLSNVLNGTSIMDMVTPINPSKLTKIQTAAIGCTCTFNAASVENTSADRINTNTPTTTPTIINCKNITMEYLGSEANGNQIRFKNKFDTSMFNGRVGTINYQHNGAVAAFNPDFNFFNSINDYRISAPPQPLPGEDPTPEPTINLRFLNPVGSGSKNLLGYKVPAGGVRLFGGTNNIGIIVGSYIRISGSPNNNGIYQVLSVIDGIDGDTLSNTATNGSTEYQYLELSRSITAQEQAVGNSITIENVSHLPILHVKYRQPL